MNNNEYNGDNHCPRCGAELPEHAAFCGSCGLNLQPAQADVLSVGDYVLMMILFSLPVAGLVLMIYWGFGSRVQVNRKHFARAYLIFYAINLVLSLLMLGAIGSITAGVVDSAMSLF